MAADDPREAQLRVPVPDPTALTTEQLRRELSGLREILTTRLDAMDRAAELLNNNVTRVPTDTDKQISHLQSLHEEKFSSIRTEVAALKEMTQKQFAERDIRSDKSEIAASTAVGAALQAQKESAGAVNEANAAAISKSENAFNKMIDGILRQQESDKLAMNSRVSEIKERLDRGEGSDTGRRDTRNEGHQTGIFTTAVVAAVISSISVVAAVIAIVVTVSHSSVPSVPPYYNSTPPTIVSPAVIPVQPNGK